MTTKIDRKVIGITVHPNGTIDYAFEESGIPNTDSLALNFDIHPVPHQPQDFEMTVLFAHILALHGYCGSLQHQIYELQHVVMSMAERLDAKADKQPSA